MVKLTKRKGFNFFRSYYDVYNELSDKDKVAFMDALLDRQFLGVKPTDLKGMSNFAYISQTNSIDSQVKGYEDKTGDKLTPWQGGGEPPTEQVEVEEEVQEKVEVEEKKGVIYPFDSETFLKFWDLWRNYKKQEHKFSYKTAVSEQAALKKLVLLGETEENCLKIIEESISNGWKGFFKLNIDGKTKSNRGAGATAQEIAEIWAPKLANQDNQD